MKVGFSKVKLILHLVKYMKYLSYVLVSFLST